MRRRLRVERFLSGDTPLDPLIHKFVLRMLLLSIFATCVRLVLSLHPYPGQFVPYGGTPIVIMILVCLTCILWRRPYVLRPVVLFLFVIVTLKIGFQLYYVLFVTKTMVDLQLIWISVLMSINYFMPFIIFRSRVASILALITLGIWIALTGIYVGIHWDAEPRGEILIVFSQLYVAHAIFIIFMALFVRLRGLYLHSEKSAFRMERLAHTDVLLGTPNRRSLQIQLRKSVDSATNTTFSVVLIDIDHFKEINDQHGHDIGDEVLIEVARLLSRYSRPSDDFGRWGGDEFLMILPYCSALDAYMVAERIRGCMERYAYSIDQVTASFGVAEFQEGDNPTSLLKRADDALYKSKRLGRNRVEIAVLEH